MKTVAALVLLLALGCGRKPDEVPPVVSVSQEEASTPVLAPIPPDALKPKPPLDEKDAAAILRLAPTPEALKQAGYKVKYGDMSKREPDYYTVVRVRFVPFLIKDATGKTYMTHGAMLMSNADHTPKGDKPKWKKVGSASAHLPRSVSITPRLLWLVASGLRYADSSGKSLASFSRMAKAWR
jgi:hypothetical protein